MTIQGSQSQPTTSPASFSVQYSDDNSAWTTAWEVTGQTGWAPGQIREFHAPIDLFFTDLADAPPSYIGQGLKALRVNSGETALEFFTFPTIPTSLNDLTDVTISGTPTDGQVLAYDADAAVFKPTSVPGVTPTAFTDLTDAPTSYAGEGGNAVRVKMTEDGLEFYTPGTGGGGGAAGAAPGRRGPSRSRSISRPLRSTRPSPTMRRALRPSFSRTPRPGRPTL
uniref:F5/8 type C domain-containing protein n=1 Tax=Caulobacter phage BL57 TaxID=3348355 RepID=A0AB74UKY6_9VIRU